MTPQDEASKAWIKKSEAEYRFSHSGYYLFGAFEEGCEKIWSDYFVPLQEKLKKERLNNVDKTADMLHWKHLAKSLQEELEKEKAKNKDLQENFVIALGQIKTLTGQR